MLDTACKEYSVIIKIAPLWYHTVWAYVGILLLLLACLVGYVYKLYRKGFFSHVARAWAVSRKGLEIENERELSMKQAALGDWADYFSHCHLPEQITFVQRILEVINENLSIQEVIESVGISSRPYFYKEFAEKYGTTPKNYRMQHRKDENVNNME